MIHNSTTSSCYRGMDQNMFPLVYFEFLQMARIRRKTFQHHGQFLMRCQPALFPFSQDTGQLVNCIRPDHE